MENPKLIGDRKFLFAMIAIAATLLIDTSFVKVYDLVDKSLIHIEIKLIIFSLNSFASFLLQFIIIRYMMNSFGRHKLPNFPRVRALYVVSLASCIALGTFVTLIIFQVFYYNFYETWINMLIVSTSYGVSAFLLLRLSLFFYHWYRSSHDIIVLLYFVSMSLIAFNLISTALFIDVKLTNVPYRVYNEFVGGGGDPSGGKYPFLSNLNWVSSLISFFSIWTTTAILMNSYREKLIRSITYWTILVLPLVYFLMTNFFKFFLSNILSSYYQNDPVTVSIIVSAFLSLSKPIGGLIFAIAFWNISRRVSYERKMKISMLITGWGIFFIFGADQASTQIIPHSPPFGISSITIMNVAAYLVVLGIYNSATLVSVNKTLRNHIHKSALKLLNPIGRAEMEREIQKTVVNISKNKEICEISKDDSFDFDENELKKYIHEVIKYKKEQLPK